MKILTLVAVFLLLIGISGVNAASISGNTVTATSALDAAALVYVSGYEISPSVLFPGETGTVTVHVTNAANTSVSVSQPNLIDPHVDVVNSAAFATATSLGPGETIDYNFVIRADGPDGTYFPLFTVSPTAYGAKAINSQITLKIDDADIRPSISLKPDTFAVSKKDMVNVSVVNPRNGDITDLLIVPETGAAEISPAETYVGTVKAGSSVQVPFAVTPTGEGSVTFHVSFQNGDNEHTKDLVLPLVLGDNKKGAEIVVNNIESSSSGSSMTLKGDVTNNGLTAAKSVLVTVGSPAEAVNPNPVYAIGNLDPDDFSSFEVTYSVKGPGSFPIVVEYKDTDGNTFTERVTYAADSFGVMPTGGQSAQSVSSGFSGSRQGSPRGMFSIGSGMNQVPVIPIAIILVVLIAILIGWRKGYLAKVTGRFRKNTQKEDEELRDQ